MLASLRGYRQYFRINFICLCEAVTDPPEYLRQNDSRIRRRINDPCEMAVHTADLSFASTPFNSSNTDATVKHISYITIGNWVNVGRLIDSL